MSQKNKDPHFICNECGCTTTYDDSIEVGGELYCVSCYDAYFVNCSRCGNTIRLSNAITDDDNDFCPDCYDAHYTRCCQCDCIITRSNAYYHPHHSDPYCHDCFDDNEDSDSYIHDYHYKPEPVFLGTGNRYFGVELEIDRGGKCSDNARKLLDTANINKDKIYIKSDGSLDCGLEIVTHPMTLAYHQTAMHWDKLLVKAKELGYLSHKTSTCGLHIHVNRDTFSNSYEFQEECIARVLYFVERFWEELLRFSRRTGSQLKQWANRYGYKEKPEEILDTAKQGYKGRYTCVNLINTHTIEFRIFRGTLKYNTLIATLQLVNEICSVAFSMSDKEMASVSWCDFMKRISRDECPELITYLKERQLYINEAVDFEEDD